MQIARASALLFSLSLFACGDDGGGTKLIDSGIGNTDAAPKVCTAVPSLGTMEADVTDEDNGRYIRYYADAGDIGGDPLYVYMTFRHSTATPTIPASVDVTADAANQDFYTCSTCVYAIQFDPATFEAKKIFFQQTGTVAFTGEPVTTRHLTANLTNLRLQEIEFDMTTGKMSYIPTGDCASVNASIDQDNLPNDWSCDAALYYTGTAGSPCNCACGYYDGDCRQPAPTTTGCDTPPGTPVCWPDSRTEAEGGIGAVCVAAVANDTCAQATVPLTTPVVGTPTTTTGSTYGANRNYNVGLNAMTCTKYRQPGPDVAHRISLTAGVKYTFNLTGLDAAMDQSIALVGPAATAAACSDNITTCVGGYDEGLAGDDETFSYTVPTGGTGIYYIIIDSFERDDAGPYTLSITTP